MEFKGVAFVLALVAAGVVAEDAAPKSAPSPKPNPPPVKQPHIENLPNDYNVTTLTNWWKQSFDIIRNNTENITTLAAEVIAKLNKSKDAAAITKFMFVDKKNEFIEFLNNNGNECINLTIVEDCKAQGRANVSNDNNTKADDFSAFAIVITDLEISGNKAWPCDMSKNIAACITNSSLNNCQPEAKNYIRSVLDFIPAHYNCSSNSTAKDVTENVSGGATGIRNLGFIQISLASTLVLIISRMVIN